MRYCFRMKVTELVTDLRGAKKERGLTMTPTTWLYGIFISMGSSVRAQNALDRLQRSHGLKPDDFAKLARLVRNYYGIEATASTKLAG